MAAGDLTTLANAKEWLSLTGTTASDSLLSRLISSCSNLIQTLMSRTIALATYVETRNGMGGCRMMLGNVPVVSVGSLIINGVAIQQRPTLSASYSTGQAGGYTFNQAELFLTGFEFCRGAQNVVITYDAGFATTPPDIEQACLDMIGSWYKYKDRIGKLSEGIEGQTIAFGTKNIPDSAMAVINAYKRVYPVY